jgi:hypothetical protein
MPGITSNKSVVHVEDGLSLQRGVNAVKVLAFFEQEVVLPDVPGHMPLFRHNLAIGRGSDESALGFLDILLVIEGHRLAQPLLQIGCGYKRWGQVF